MISIKARPCAREGNLGVWAFGVFSLKSNGIMSFADEVYGVWNRGGREERGSHL